jgi:signal transduction histidine kinase
LNLSRYADEPFSPEELMALTQIGQIAALAVRNARLFGELEAASRSKTDFLNLAAHELRTPISVIKGYVSLIAEGSLGELPSQLLQPLAIIGEKTAELNRLVEDLLAAARVQAGSIAVNVQEVDVGALVEAAVERARPSLDLAQGRLELELPARELRALLDPAHLDRILDNLLNNAVAYSTGPPELRVALREDGARLRIEVQDRGRGIPGEDQERVFDQFVRLEDSRYGYAPGTGLGLYISRGLAQRHGGDVVLVESTPGAGSTFAVVLPHARG